MVYCVVEMVDIFEVLRNNKTLTSYPTPTFSPYSLKHWALATVVESAVKSTVDDNFPFKINKCSIPLFEELKVLHRRGSRFLDYEFSFTEGLWYYPLNVLIDNYEKKYASATCWCAPIIIGMDRLKPYCSCCVGGEKRNIVINGHSHLCKRK